MREYYDALETRDRPVRERELFARLRALVARAMSAPGWSGHLAGVDPNSVTSRAALAKLPVLRKSSFPALQKERPPFGGLNVTAPGQVRRLLMSPGPIFEPEGEGKAYAGVARALFASGFRAGGVVHNSFSYQLTPGVTFAPMPSRFDRVPAVLTRSMSFWFPLSLRSNRAGPLLAVISRSRSPSLSKSP